MRGVPRPAREPFDALARPAHSMPKHFCGEARVDWDPPTARRDCPGRARKSPSMDSAQRRMEDAETALRAARGPSKLVMTRRSDEQLGDVIITG